MRTALVQDGVVVNVIDVPSGYVPPVIDGEPPTTAVASESVSAGWTYDGVTLTPPTEPAPTVEQLSTVLLSAVSAACRTITTTIATDTVHLNGYVNAYALVGLTGTVPTEDPSKTSFATMAAAFGQAPADFATRVTAVGAVSLELSAVLTIATEACTAARSVDALRTAYESAQTALNASVQRLSAVGITITNGLLSVPSLEEASS